MSAPSVTEPGRLPTLTEVLDVPTPVESDLLVDLSDPLVAEPPEAGPAPAIEPARQPSTEATAMVDEAQVVHAVLTDLQRQIDLMLEYRLRETLAPALARATDTLIRDTRNELASTLREVVARAVDQELTRRRGRES